MHDIHMPTYNYNTYMSAYKYINLRIIHMIAYIPTVHRYIYWCVYI